MAVKSAHWRLNEGEVSSEVIDGELIVMHHKLGRYYSSAGIGALVWTGLVDGLSTQATCEAVAGRCGVSPQAIAGDIQAFIASLVEEQLLQESIADTEAPVTVAARGGALAYARPQLQVYTDMKDLLQLNPIHDVSEEGWPTRPTADKV